MGTAHPAPTPHPPIGAEPHSGAPRGRERRDTPLNIPEERLPHLAFVRRQTARELTPGPPPPRDSKRLKPLPKGHQQEDCLRFLVPPAQPSPWASGHHPGVRLRVLPPSSGSHHLYVLCPLLKGPPSSLSSCALPAPPPQEAAFQVLPVEVP